MSVQMEKLRDFDVDAIRKDFPILNQAINGHPLVYLDNAATSQKPQIVLDKIDQYYREYNANVHRAIHALGEKATLSYEDARSKVQHFINAKSPKECVFVRGATEAINLVARSYVQPRIQPGEQILLTELEHHSNIVPWQLLCHDTGAVLRVVPINQRGELDLERFEQLLTPDVKVLAIGHVSNAIGTINPLKKLIKMAHDNDTIVVVDGAQAAPHLDIDVQDLDCDFYAISGHKLYGPTGIGVLYGKQDYLDASAPYQGGGEMITQVTFENTTYQKAPYRFEAGTPNIAGAIGLGAAIDYLNQLDTEAIAAYEDHLLEYATAAFKSLKGFNIVGTAKEKIAVISFVHGKIHAHDIGTVLNSQGIAVRSGHHCAMPLMDALGVEATSRISLSFYNTKQEIDDVIKALEKVREVFG